MIEMRFTFPSLAAALAVLASACGGTSATQSPTAPNPVASSGPNPLVVYTPVQVNEINAFDVDPVVRDGGTYCEIGNDPAPCAWFSVEVPQPSMLTIRADADTSVQTFIDSPVHQFFASTTPPVSVQSHVEPGNVKFKVGLNAPWGFRGAPVHFRLLVTLN
jgi:hypothetical protein